MQLTEKMAREAIDRTPIPVMTSDPHHPSCLLVIHVPEEDMDKLSVGELCATLSIKNEEIGKGFHHAAASSFAGTAWKLGEDYVGETGMAVYRTLSDHEGALLVAFSVEGLPDFRSIVPNLAAEFIAGAIKAEKVRNRWTASHHVE